jgi:hypothetical protein
MNQTDEDQKRGGQPTCKYRSISLRGMRKFVKNISTAVGLEVLIASLRNDY